MKFRTSYLQPNGRQARDDAGLRHGDGLLLHRLEERVLVHAEPSPPAHTHPALAGAPPGTVGAGQGTDFGCQPGPARQGLR